MHKKTRDTFVPAVAAPASGKTRLDNHASSGRCLPHAGDRDPTRGEAPSPADEPQAQTQPAPPAVPVDLFDRAGVKFPKKAQSLTTALILIWIALFLLDVAVRRIALDTAAIARRVKSWLPGKRAVLVAGGTLDKLRRRRDQLREQLRSRPKDAFASRRFEAGEDAKASELPKAKTAEQPAPEKPEPKAPAKRTPARTEAEQTHLQQLLKARRKAKDHLRGPQDSLGKDDRTPPTGDS